MKVTVVVPVRNAETTIDSTVSALLRQVRGVEAEILITVSDADRTAARVLNFVDPQLRVMVMPGRRSVPQLRRDAVLACDTDLVVITEDHCLFPDDWLSKFIESARHQPLVGGGVANGRRSLTGWAQYFTRYAQFIPPIREGVARHLSGNNACYRRELFVQNRGLLAEGFWEAEFNAAVSEQHQPLYMLAENDVIQHQDRGIFEYVPLRFRHGRCYGARRADKSLLRIPLIPAILFLRVVRAVFAKRQHRIQFAMASPLIVLYFLAWAIGEGVGYLFGASEACSDTD